MCTLKKYLRGFSRGTTYFVISKNCFSTVDVSKHRSTMIICNTSDFFPGEHWVAFYIYRKNSRMIAEFFDSFGKSPHHYGIESPFLVSMYNNISLQSEDSASCGLFCLFFLYYRLKQRSFKKIVSMFCNSVYKNEILVNKFHTILVRKYK